MIDFIVNCIVGIHAAAIVLLILALEVKLVVTLGRWVQRSPWNDWLE